VSRTLVLLHGVASNSTRWSEFREGTRLKGWEILTPDLRGNASAAAPRTSLGTEIWPTLRPCSTARRSARAR
jgi:pimeloyl-ACP methyl ester carboxylesterase